MSVETKMCVTIPESVNYYFSDNNKAMMQAFDSNVLPPVTFTFDEVKDFYRAKNNIALCKMELFSFLTEIVQKIWVDGIKKQGVFLPLTWGKISTGYEYIYSPDSVWKDKYQDYNCAYWYFQSNDHKYQICCGCYAHKSEKEKNFRLITSLYIYRDGEYIEFDKSIQGLDKLWENEEIDLGIYLKNDEHQPLIMDNSLDVTPLAAITAKTLDDIVTHYNIK